MGKMSGIPIQIDDPHDPRIQVYADLRSNLAKPPGGYFIAEGKWVSKRLINSSFQVHSILIMDSLVEETIGWTTGFQADQSFPIYVMPKSMISQLVGYPFHRGMLACGVRKQEHSTEEFLASNSFRKSETPRLSVFLDDIVEAENVGTILRTCAGFGVDQILLGPRTIDPFVRRAVRVSMASVFHQSFYRAKSTSEMLALLAASGQFRIVASTLSNNARNLREYETDDRSTILMVGNEATGLTEETLALVTDRFQIPMHLETDSLNVAAATAIFLYQLTQRSIV